MNKLFGIGFQDGTYGKYEGNNIMEAYAKTERKTLTGEIDFGQMDFYFEVPIGTSGTDSFQTFLKKGEKLEWEPIDHISGSFLEEESFMKMKVKLEGLFAGMVIRLSDEKPVSLFIL